jgi:DNA-binding winged helix-turn-helix (wHTH) protein
MLEVPERDLTCGWPDVFVAEGNLTVHVVTLRRVLGDTRRSPAYIETVSPSGIGSDPRVSSSADFSATMSTKRKTTLRKVGNV